MFQMCTPPIWRKLRGQALRPLRLTAVFGLTVLSAPHAVQAGVCEDAWFTRNSIMNDAGYCFGSALGQAYFDNSDCTGKSVQLSAQDQARVAQLQSTEAYQNCRIDTSQTALDLEGLDIRLQLGVQPVIFEEGEGFHCIGYYGPLGPLHAAPDRNSRVIGALRAGDWFVTAHLDIGPWQYLSVRHPDTSAIVAGGWTRLPHEFYKACEQAAG